MEFSPTGSPKWNLSALEDDLDARPLGSSRLVAFVFFFMNYFARKSLIFSI